MVGCPRDICFAASLTPASAFGAEKWVPERCAGARDGLVAAAVPVRAVAKVATDHVAAMADRPRQIPLICLLLKMIAKIVSVHMGFFMAQKDNGIS